MRSITIKLILAFLGISMTSILLTAFLARWNTRSEFIRFVSNQYQQNLTVKLAEYYQSHSSWQGVEAVFELSPDPEHPYEHRRPPFILIDTTGRALVANGPYRPGDRVTPEEIENSTTIEVNGQIVGRLVPLLTDFPGDPREEEFIHRTNQTLLIGAGGVTLLALLLGIFLSRTIARPIRELTRAAHAISEGTLGQQVTIHARDELGELAQAFNKMSSELARSVNARRQMTADIAHELRTPLSLILGHAEAVHDGVLPPSHENFEIIREEALHLEKLVEDLRTLSLADAGELTIQPQAIAPQRLLEEVLALYRFQAQSKNLSLALEVEPELPLISVDPGRMTQVLLNVLDNALRHTPEGGQVTLAARRTPRGVELLVRDSGPGLPPEDLERIFERFYRTSGARGRQDGGSGLGLAIARSIVLAHQGQIHAESTPGQGLTVVISLPAAK